MAAPESGASPERGRARVSLLERPWAIATTFVAALFAAFPVGFVRSGLLDGGDDALANLPELVYSGRKLLEGEVLWTPDLWMGHPLLGEPEFATLYLPKLFLQLGAPVPLYAAYVLLHFLAAEVNAYFYSRSLGISRRGAIFGAVAYGFTGFMIGHRGHTMYVCAGAWAPLVLLLVDRAERLGRGKDYLLAALAFSMLPFSGAVQLTVYLGGTALLLAGTRAVLERSPRALVSALLCLVAGGLVAALQILPALSFSGQLATDLRVAGPSTAQSFHPALFPTLFLPTLPSSAEHYARMGVAVLCAAFVAVRGLREAPAHVRAWAAVAGVAFVLMLGAYVPVLPDLLQHVPVIRIFRLPVRHNFELGLALSVLSAYGVDRMTPVGPENVRRWATSGVAIGILSVLVLWIGGKDRITGTEAAFIARQVSWVPALGAALAFFWWVTALNAGARLHAAAAWTLPLLPLAELAWSEQIVPVEYRDFRRLSETAASALPASGWARLFVRPFQKGSIDSFNGNTTLLHHDVQNLLGYSSIAYSSARTLFDLDMFGQPENADDVAWSPLPSVFGATHVVLPFVAPARASAVFDGEPTCGSAPPANPPVLRRETSCSFRAVTTPPTYVIRTEASAPSSDTAGIGFGVFSSEARRELFIPGKLLTPGFAERALDFRASTFPRTVNFGGENAGAIPVVLRNPRIEQIAFEPIVELGRAVPSRSVHAARDAAGTITLSPGGDVALFEARVERPPDRSAELRLVARAPSGTPKDLVLDLFDERGFDPEAAQIVVPAAELGPNPGEWKRTIALDGAPEAFSLRAVTGGDAVVVLETAALGRSVGTVVSRFPVSRGPAARRLEVSGNDVRFGPRGGVGGLLHLPVHPITLRLEAEALEPGLGKLVVGVTRPKRRADPLEVSPKLDVPKTGRFVSTLTVHEAPDEPVLVASAHLEAPPGAEPGALLVHSLTVSEASEERRYENPKPLANGLFLYENRGALPRAYTVAEAVVERDLTAIRRLLRALRPADVGRSAVVEEALPPLFAAEVTRTSFEPRTTTVDVRAALGPTLLVVNDRWDPGWSARLDAAPARILRVNGLVRGILVPRGEHRVTFHYDTPRSVWLGLAAALSGVLLALAFAPGLRRRFAPNDLTE